MRNLLLHALFVGLFGLVCCGPPASQPVTAQPTATASRPGKIPIDTARWYQVCNASAGLGKLFDGRVNQRINTGWNKLLPTCDAYYRLLPGEQITIQRIRFYDGEGTATETPVTLSIITADWQRIPIARFVGETYQQWVGPDPARPDVFDLARPIANARYLVLTATNAYPDEIELIGTYQPGKLEPESIVEFVSPFSWLLGINAFEWNVAEGNAPSHPDETLMSAIRNFSGFRHYLDWGQIEPKPGQYTFNPTTHGSWNYDAMYERLKAEHIDVLVCLKTIPDWLQTTYPADHRDYENIPARFGSDLRSPASYREQARAGFQLVARYGFNKTIDPKLVTVSRETTWAGKNTVKIGLGLIRYIECDNERDKTWKGRTAYQSAREYAANLSAFYDGHRHTLGPDVGVKTADPSVIVVMGGLAGATTDYLRGMIDWCREFRGYLPDGRVNLCWDVINQHFYANDAGSSQQGGGERGAAPERSGLTKMVTDLMTISRREAGGMPVWISEIGYDQNPGSPFRAIAIGSKSVAETQADWTLRTALLLSRMGVERTFFYQLYDENPASATQFASMGLLNADKSRKPAADYVYQARALLGDYHYVRSLPGGPAGLLIDQYELFRLDADVTIYALVVPNEQGRTATYELPVLAQQVAELYRPAIGKAQMSREPLVSSSGLVTVPVTETPVFVVVRTRK